MEVKEKAYTLDEIKRLITPIAQQFGIEKLALFGSYARGDQNEDSDLDFLIKKGSLRGMFQFCGFINRLEDELGVHVDVLTYDSLQDSLIQDAIKDEVVLYER